MSHSAQPSSSPALRLKDAWPRFVHVYQKEIWQSALLKDRSPKGAFYAVLRVISITVTVFAETRVATRAAALGFSSLLGLGPLLAIAVLVAGFALGKNDPRDIADTINDLLKVVAPQLQQFELQQEQARAEYEYLTQDAADPKVAENQPEPGQNMVDVIEKIITASQSGSAGVLGAFALIVIVLLLFKAIEDTFNDIWGVRQGRSVLTRIVLYWTILTLGAVLFFSAVALLSAGTFVNVFAERLPAWVTSLGWTLPLFSFFVITLMLMIFYRVIPNTHVIWRAAFIGALVVGALLMLNNLMQFLYVERVYRERSLYGGLALPLVIMFGLYIFWLCVLTGGIVSYAIQNVHFRNSQAAWSTLSESMREKLALVVFLTICRRFRECLPPISASHLSMMLKVPAQLLNECLNRLVQLKMITTVRPDPNNDTSDYLYQPARPLNRLTLFDFKTLDDNLGENPIGASLGQIDPLITEFDTAVNRLGDQEFFQKTVEQLLEEHPSDGTRPPFAMGGR